MVETVFRRTLPRMAILTVLLEHQQEELYGLQVIELTGMESGVVYPILRRLDKIGWVTSRLEKADPSAVGRPLRRFYQLESSAVPLVQDYVRRR